MIIIKYFMIGWCLQKISHSFRRSKNILKCVFQNHQFAKALQLADDSEEASMDMFTGAHLYCQIVTAETKWSNMCNLITIKSVLAELSVDQMKVIIKATIQLSFQYRMLWKLAVKKGIISKRLHQFLNLNEIAILPLGLYIYEKFESSFKFESLFRKIASGRISPPSTR